MHITEYNNSTEISSSYKNEMFRTFCFFYKENFVSSKLEILEVLL